MPVREINLITTRHGLSPEEQRIHTVIAFWTPIVLLIFALVIVSVLGYSFVLSRQSASLDQQIADLEQQISQKRQIEGLYLLLKQKSNSLGQIIKTRYPYSTVFGMFQNLKVPGVTIRNMKLSDDANVVIEVSVADSSALDQYIRGLLDSASSHFQTVELVNLVYQHDSTYYVVLNIGYKTG